MTAAVTSCYTLGIAYERWCPACEDFSELLFEDEDAKAMTVGELVARLKCERRTNAELYLEGAGFVDHSHCDTCGAANPPAPAPAPEPEMNAKRNANSVPIPTQVPEMNAKEKTDFVSIPIPALEMNGERRPDHIRLDAHFWDIPQAMRPLFPPEMNAIPKMGYGRLNRLARLVGLDTDRKPSVIRIGGGRYPRRQSGVGEP